MRVDRVRTASAILALGLGVLAVAAHGASGDRSEPATIEADEVEFDFRTGTRTYKGDVVVVQGTLRVTGDKMVIQYDEAGQQIETATSYGNPATFKQRPDGKEHDVYGEGQTIVLNEIVNTLTLIEDAVMTQAGNTAKGREIVYDMATDKMTVKGMQQQQVQDTGETATTDSETGRARVIITPEEQQAAGGGSTGGTGEATEEAADSAADETGGDQAQPDTEQTAE